ncbi:DUF4185 domain-containing protein [Corynebacterium sanguinis]|nr:DUF4185 domain-containing protein [Corynebacterium sanguinis]MCT1412341.1 DUF4185 domain-containing protein [Corynebacterium sanguinis]MCT1463837.1 DUF4185 domain-containing protein [Corynebacterium sanguinis]MCT1498925.1 DUF4185 domain-containing protein [Corynebacterium sanguinis]MCT2328760.1 DUF4185 domain-containing protein [Corynebacterium sanguinis]
MRITSRTLALVTIAALSATTLFNLASSPATAQSSLSSSGTRPTAPDLNHTEPGTPVVMPGEFIVQIMGDILGPGISDLVGFRSGDLGIMAPLDNGTFALIFGDSFRETGLRGEWMSPVGVVAQLVNGIIEIIRPLNAGDKVEQLLDYPHVDGLTLIPSDMINIDGTLYMQGMWNRGIGNVLHTEIWKSTDNGRTWASLGTTPTTYLSGMGDLISWERGQDGYIYVVSSSFKRDHPVYLSRFMLDNIADRSAWEVFNPATGSWSTSGAPILSGVQAGEMNLRFIDGHWVLAMFNEQTLQIEVRVSDTLAQNWNSVPVAVVARHGSWTNEQTPLNFSQPYGAYIVPGSTLANMDIVISQWNTSNNSRYNSTQFNVKGLDTYFGVDKPAIQAPEVVSVEEQPAAAVEEQVLEDALLEQATN